MKCVIIVLLTAALATAAPNPNALFKAVSEDNADLIRTIVAESPELLEARDALNFTPLLKAAVDGKPAAAATLIELGANLEAGDNEGSTPLMNAAASAETDIVRLLIDAGANVNARDENGMSAVLFAGYRGLDDILDLLTQAGGSLLDTSNAGSTALHGAATFNVIDIIPRLIDAGIDINKSNIHGYTPLLAAVSRGNREAAELLLDAGADASAVNAGGEGALHFVTMTGDTVMAAALMKAGAPVDPIGEGGYTPLMYAAARRQLDLMKFLLAHGADATIADGNGRPPLLGAAIEGVWEAFPMLLMADGRTDLCEPNNHRTLLHLAAQQGQRGAVEALLTRGADINATDIDGRTPADLAVRYSHPEVYKCLKTAGAKSHGPKPKFGECPMLHADYAPGDAAFWYLGHCGWAVKTAGKLLVFDYFNPTTPPANPCLSNGHLCAKELAEYDVYFFVTHEHPDHFDSSIFAFAEQLPHVTYIYGFDPDQVSAPGAPAYAGPAFTRMAPHETEAFDGMNVTTIASNDAGVGFYVEVDGLKLYHAGDHAGWRENERAGFVNEIDWLGERAHDVDVAFVNVTGCHVRDTVSLNAGNAYTIEKLNPKVVVPTHGLNQEHVYAIAADRFHAMNSALQVPCPICRGDRFVYRGGKMSM